MAYRLISVEPISGWKLTYGLFGIYKYISIEIPPPPPREKNKQTNKQKSKTKQNKTKQKQTKIPYKSIEYFAVCKMAAHLSRSQ